MAFLERATQIDPNFAMAYDEMSNAHAILGETALSAEEIGKAFDLRARASGREKLIIEEDFYSLRIGNLIKVRRVSEVGEQTYPRELSFHLALAGLSNALGQYETGVKEGQEALRLRPYTPILYRQVFITFLSLNRTREAEALAEEVRTKGLDSHLEGVLYGMAFYRQDTAEMTRPVARASGIPGEEDLLRRVPEFHLFAG